MTALRFAALATPAAAALLLLVLERLERWALR